MRFKIASPKALDSNSILSLSRNFEPKTRSEFKTTPVVKTETKLKQILKVYVSSDKRKFIDKAAAYALKMINVRAIMLEDSDQLIEITDRQLEGLSKKNIEIQYQNVENSYIPPKQNINVYYEGIEYYIEPSAAYALGLITIENWNAMGNSLYRVSENLLMFLKNKYDVKLLPKEDASNKAYR